ncbi:hypothetical protein DdX_17269 [Ditylenchus destructor]|uniref:F-box domain-containing protein n=1 Tax=Ditylenchus destructor TaxID=166010 RepID=A0AAD4QZ55_9BILA|nr:hypothetical protein DdX_17269 [Ditylenchus destructor]
MSLLPTELFSDITNFLPNDDITDLMLLSKNFNSLVTPRLQKIDQEMATMNQTIETFMPVPMPDSADLTDEWISQLNLKKFEPIGSQAKRRMREVFRHPDDLLCCLQNAEMGVGSLDKLQKGMSLERFDDATFLRILGALVGTPKFRQEYNISYNFFASSKFMYYISCLHLNACKAMPVHGLILFGDVLKIWSF